MFTKNRVLFTLIMIVSSSQLICMWERRGILESPGVELYTPDLEEDETVIPLPKDIYVTSQNQPKIAPLSTASKSLFDAIEKGDKQGVINALNKGADINAYNDFGRTPFGWLLIKHKDNKTTIEIATVLLTDKNLDINKIEGDKPIIFDLIWMRNGLALELIKRFINRGDLDLDVVWNIGFLSETPLQTAQRANKIHNSRWDGLILKALEDYAKTKQ